MRDPHIKSQGAQRVDEHMLPVLTSGSQGNWGPRKGGVASGEQREEAQLLQGFNLRTLRDDCGDLGPQSEETSENPGAAVGPWWIWDVMSPKCMVSLPDIRVSEWGPRIWGGASRGGDSQGS